MLVTLGRSVQRRPIQAYVRGSGSSPVLVLGGVHGDEPKSVALAKRLIELLESDSGVGRCESWVVAWVVNPDGHERRSRRNTNRVDINRNFPTSNWTRMSRRSRMFGGDAPASEPETRAIIRAVQRYRPSRIISIHSISRGRHCNNYDGPAAGLATAMRRCNGYPVRASIGYPTPGSFGVWAGRELGIPVVTLELPAHHSNKQCWEDNRRALLCRA